MNSSAMIEQAARVLAAHTASPARVIVFGSSARDEATPDSDIDFLVIEREVQDRVAEAVRLRDKLGNIGVPVDIIVIDEELAARREKVPGSVVHAALREGRLLAQS